LAQLRIEVLSGSSAGQVVESELSLVKIGRGTTNDVVLADAHVSNDHLRLVASVEGFIVEDLESSNGTWILRGSERLFLDDGRLSSVLLSGDVLEVGGTADEGTQLRIQFAAEEEPAQVVAVRPIEALPKAEAPSDSVRCSTACASWALTSRWTWSSPQWRRRRSRSYRAPRMQRSSFPTS